MADPRLKTIINPENHQTFPKNHDFFTLHFCQISFLTCNSTSDDSEMIVLLSQVVEWVGEGTKGDQYR